MRRQSILSALASVALAFGVLVYQGPGHVFIRGSGGDVCIAAFLVFVLGAVFPKLKIVPRALVAFAICCGAELVQLLEIPIASTRIGQLTLGSHFDSLDFPFYALGVTIAVALERVVARTREAPLGRDLAGS